MATSALASSDDLAGGVRRYFEEIVDLLERDVAPEPSELGAIAARHGLEVDRDSIPRLTQSTVAFRPAGFVASSPSRFG